jgi:hypothetical protein
MTREGVITKGTTIGNGKSANPGDIVSLPVDVFTKLAMTKDIRPLTEADRKKPLTTTRK